MTQPLPWLTLALVTEWPLGLFRHYGHGCPTGKHTKPEIIPCLLLTSHLLCSFSGDSSLLNDKIYKRSYLTTDYSGDLEVDNHDFSKLSLTLSAIWNTIAMVN